MRRKSECFSLREPLSSNAELRGDGPASPARRPLDCRVMPMVETENGNDRLQEHV